MPRRRGFLLTVEGVDGCGKSTQVRRIASYLRKAGHPVTVVREPGGTRLAERVRRLLLDFRSADLTRSAELFLYLAARGQLYTEIIAPALARGDIVVCDRFTDSTLAYQGDGRGFPVPLLRQLNDLSTLKQHPDLTLFLDLPLTVSNRRKGKVADRLESEQKQFYRRVLRGFRRLAKAEPKRVVRIDARGDIPTVTQQIREVLDHRIGRRR